MWGSESFLHFAPGPSSVVELQGREESLPHAPSSSAYIFNDSALWSSLSSAWGTALCIPVPSPVDSESAHGWAMIPEWWEKRKLYPQSGRWQDASTSILYHEGVTFQRWLPTP